MVFVNNIPEVDFTKKKPAERGKWYARFFENTEDGIVSCWEHKIDHEPTAEDYASLEAQCLQLHKSWLKMAIGTYDTSDVVNGFLLNGEHAWLPKHDRTSLRELVMIQKESGQTHTTLWYEGRSYNPTCDDALAMLNALELYASQCYNNTAAHTAAVDTLTSLQEVKAYDYTTGYPEQLSFNL